MAVTELMNRLAAAWRTRVGTASRQALLCALVLAITGGAHLARNGTTPARLGTAAIIALVIAAMVVRAVRERRTYLDLRRTIRQVLVPANPELGQRTLRAVSLLERTARDDSAGSPELARLHFERLIARASVVEVEASATRRARWWQGGVMLGLAAVVVSFAVGPMRVVEGLDVLFAWKGRAPLPLAWLDYMRVSAEPPAYLKLPERSVLPGLASRHPEGTLLSVRGVPRRDGRRLVLTDGVSEVPFVSDGAGGVVARWTLERTGELHVAARFGGVLIHELETIPVTLISDEVPEVSLAGAPKTLELKGVESLPLAYEASDDHGLRQVDVVLRAGEREDRRVIARLDGQSTFERGSHVLSPRDPFLRRMYLPIQVTVEARDNDPVRGPKWGQSPAITLIPPVVGEPEALRYSALAKARGELIDFLAWQLGRESGKDLEPLSKDERERARRVADAVLGAVDKSHGGLGFPPGLRAFVAGQMRVLERPSRPGESRIRRSEDVTLAVDSVLRVLGSKDAQSVAKRLADVVEEIANGAKQARETEKKSVGLARLDSALGASEAGAKRLIELGFLGRDLGSVAVADLGRVQRARKADDLTHAELAARHLAARLRRPNPSFGSAQRGGVESGAPSQNGGSSGEPSDANDRFDELAAELEKLAADHADEIGKVERALSEAEASVDLESIREEAKQRADALRRALADLPQFSHTPGSARSAAALGREHGTAMAESLERLSLGDAVQSGKDALNALKDAEKKAGASDLLDRSELEASKSELARQLAWAEQRLDDLKKNAQHKSRDATSSSGEREHEMSRRAGNLASRGKNGDTALPEEALESLEKAEGLMREAARALVDGRGERGLELQREAQRLLEQATTGQTGEDEEQSPHDSRPKESRDGQGKDMRTGGEVPRDQDKKRAEEFRRRVVEGLGKSKDGRLAPAVKRYAEGLLR
ncbi:MAG: DUF4175 domain-containing protein [Polyangiaceae bacterium]|nr:DUF4175 domain-containing protein [Polyangiaceae bacterium]MCL4749659.1 DUF4175 domain-containing protein [Myxococcales bacterium]